MGLNDRAIEYIANNIDSDDVQKGISRFIDEKIFPELEEIRERASTDVPHAQARADLEALSPEKRRDVFHGVLGDIIATLFEIRVRPMSGLDRAKEMLRDPYVTEGILLIFEHPDVEDDERNVMKEFAADHLKALGVAVAPEMYERDEVVAVAEKFGVDRELIDYYDDQYEEAGKSQEGDVAQAAED